MASRGICGEFCCGPVRRMGVMGMTDQDNLRDRIMGVLRKHKLSRPKGGTAAGAWFGCSCGTVETTSSRDHAELLAQRHQAQAIIDEFGLTVHGDDCGYHEIHGSYDTRFEARQ